MHHAFAKRIIITQVAGKTPFLPDRLKKIKDCTFCIDSSVFAKDR